MIKTDKDGNKLIVMEDGIYLKLLREKKRRQIFGIRRATVEKYVKPKNIMREIGEEGAIGFNYSALKLLKDRLKVQKIILRIGGRTPIQLKIKDIIKNGQFLYFLEEVFELQIFLPIEKM